MKLAAALFASVALAGPALAGSGLAGPSIEYSARAAAWSGDRTGTNESIEASAEIWLRARQDLGNGATLRFEGWAGVNPDGTGRANADLREAQLRFSVAGLSLAVGRQVTVWGRADRINPTDVAAARDYRRLVEDEIGAIFIGFPWLNSA